jgi:drug/metabolite transporter (DMT)-like permease
MLFWRFALAALFFLVFFPRKITFQDKKGLLLSLTYGLCLYSPCAILYFQASELIGSGLAMVIFYTYPVWLVIINRIFYRMATNWIHAISLSMTLLGLFCFIDNFSLSNLSISGVFISLFSAFLYALYLLFSRKLSLNLVASSFYLCFGCMPTCFMAAVLGHQWVIPVDPSLWLAISGIGIVCTALPILLLLIGLQQVGSTQAAILSVLEPVFVLICGIFLLNESLSLKEIIGAMVILSGALISIIWPPQESSMLTEDRFLPTQK